MRKINFMCAIIGLAICLASQAWASGRLNFMLINLTGHDIVDAKICPTYFPKFESENLLKTALDPNSKIYIGPNYYGEQKFWTIALKWNNGYEQTFPKLQLTRYNTYTVYSTPQGIKIRQTYEPASARYEFGTDAPSYMGAEPDVKVKASAPEKLAKIPASPQVTVIEPGKPEAKSSPRNLKFDEASSANNNGLALKTTVEMTRDGKTSTVSPTGDFKNGDQVKLVFSSNKDGHIYWVSKNPDGQYRILFPTAQPGSDNTVVHNKEYTVPSEPLKFDGNKGMETIFAILSPKALPDLDKAIKLGAEGKNAEASKLVADVVSGHEQKRTAGELLFEEEDDDDVNEQYQLADGEQPFVGRYELSRE